MRSTARGHYAAVTSTLALVVALGGTSYAAVVVTGDDIKDGTVSTKDVKDKTLKVRDISAAARDALRGERGPVGATGATGPAGPPGAPGAAAQSAPIFSVQSHPQSVMADIPVKVLSLSLGPGAYFVSSKYLAVSTSVDGTVECHLEAEGITVQDFGAVTFAAADETATVHNQIAFTAASPTSAYLYCRGSGAFITWKMITAVQAASATVVDQEAAP
jgi:hypothetical protein